MVSLITLFQYSKIDANIYQSDTLFLLLYTTTNSENKNIVIYNHINTGMKKLTAELNKMSECEMCSITAKQMAKWMVSLMTLFYYSKIDAIIYHCDTLFLPVYFTTIYEKTNFRYHLKNM
jgi:hypothetical protein